MRRRLLRPLLALCAAAVLLAGGWVFANRKRGHGSMEPLSTGAGLVAPAAADGAADVRLRENVAFGKGGEAELRLDLAAPAAGDGPFPAVVCIHGGAWCSGSKREYRGGIRTLARHGYVAASVEYRLAPQHKFPAQIEDVKCAVRYLRAHAEELSVDPDRIGAMGDSAGGHLALLLGLMDPADGLEGSGGWPEQPSKVQAVAEYFGPADFTQWRIVPLIEPFIKKSLGKDSREIMLDFLGSIEPGDPILAKASPITYVSRGDPPVLTFHGTADVLVPIKQSRILHEALKVAEVPCTLVPVTGAMHGWGGPQKAETDRQTIAFFDRWLKGVGDGGQR